MWIIPIELKHFTQEVFVQVPFMKSSLRSLAFNKPVKTYVIFKCLQNNIYYMEYIFIHKHKYYTCLYSLE